MQLGGARVEEVAGLRVREHGACRLARRSERYAGRQRERRGRRAHAETREHRANGRVLLEAARPVRTRIQRVHELTAHQCAAAGRQQRRPATRCERELLALNVREM